MGRLFDGVASMIGLRSRTSFEGQAAMELEWLATGVPAEGHYPIELDGPLNADCACPSDSSAARCAGRARSMSARSFAVSSPI